MKRCGKLLIGWMLVLALAVICAGAAAEAGGACGDNLTWKLSDSGILTVSGNGEMNATPWQSEHSAEIRKVVIENGVTSLATYSFWGCENLESVSLPESLRKIGYGSFVSCKALKELRIPDGVTEVASYLYSYDSVPEIYASIGSTGAKALGKAGHSFKPDGEKYFLRYKYDANGQENGLAFAKCDEDVISVAIPAGVTSIDPSAFENNKGLVSVTIPEGVTQIGHGAFRGCTGLTGITLPKSLKVLEGYVFLECDGIKEIILPDDLESVQNYAFGFSSKIRLITGLGTKAAKALGEAGYSFCPKGAAYSLQYNSSGELVITGCGDEVTSLRIPEGVTAVENNAFYGKTKLTYVSLPSTLKEIGERAFSNCGLTEIRIPEGVSAIGANAFYGCSGLTEITIPASVKSIPEEGFTGYKGTLRFSGDAPAFAGNALRSAYLICRYSAEKTGWTETVQNQYGAAWVKWIPENAQQAGSADTDPDPSEELKTVRTTNADAQEYDYVWNGGVINSYLTPQKDGTYLRVEKYGQYVLVERYSAQKQLVWRKTMTMELPLWGGYFSGKDYHFLVFAQNNPQEDNNREILRVVRYSQNWHRIDAVSICGANTYESTAFGSLRMTQSGDFLYIHSAHTMYQSQDGLHHQSNMSYKIHIPSMSVIREDNTVCHINNDYTSHSFNQFVVIDGEDVIELNHGDAYPRSIVLNKSTGTANKPMDDYTDNQEVDLLKFIQIEGRQYQDTGAMVGGLEASATHYLAAGKSIDQTVGTGYRYNIFVTSVPKDQLEESAVSVIWLTNYTTAAPKITNPQLVKISPVRFLLMWTETSGSTVLKYALLDEKGRQTGEIHSIDKVSLSDCHPVVDGDKVIWYVTQNSTAVFHEISLSELGVQRGGWYETEKGKGYTGGDGNQKTGWMTLDSGTYYMGKDGVMRTGKQQIGGDSYLFREDGTLVTGWIVEDGKLYYYTDKGNMLADVTQNVGGITFTFLADGAVADPIPGDVTEDGLLDGRDVIRLMKWLAEETDEETGELVKISETNADLNGDGKVDELDLLRLVRWLGGENQ